MKSNEVYPGQLIVFEDKSSGTPEVSVGKVSGLCNNGKYVSLKKGVDKFLIRPEFICPFPRRPVKRCSIKRRSIVIPQEIIEESQAQDTQI